MRQRVGLVFQMPERQLFSPTVREELAFAPANAGFEGEALDEAVLGALRAVGLREDFLSRSPFQLSGGEQRLTAIASTLAAGPDCVVLDEPLAGLDAAYRRGILALLTRLRDEGRSVVTITHDLDMALCFSDRVLVMDGGRSLAEGTPQEVLPSLMEALRPDVWPGALQVSARLRARHPSFPLVWRVEALWDLLRQGFSPDFERPSPSSARGGA
nr:ATP-binding cassette domain-containing protein [Fretibacterium fastidiosum]